jgi:hypothetical protein
MIRGFLDVLRFVRVFWRARPDANCSVRGVRGELLLMRVPDTRINTANGPIIVDRPIVAIDRRGNIGISGRIVAAQIYSDTTSQAPPSLAGP